MQTFLYVLVDPFDNEPKYVGISVDPYKRLAGHVSTGRQNEQQKHQSLLLSLKQADLFETDGGAPSSLKEWLARLTSHGHKPHVFLVSDITCAKAIFPDGKSVRTCDCQQHCSIALAAEKQLIKFLEEKGFNLFNIQR